MEGGNIQTAVAGGKLGLMVLVYGIGWVLVRWAMDKKKETCFYILVCSGKYFISVISFQLVFFATPLLGLQLL